MTPERFQSSALELIAWIARYRQRAQTGEFPVLSKLKPGEVRANLPASPPFEPEDFAAVLRDLEQVILPGVSHWQHPNFFGYFPANANLASVLGDFVSSGLGVIGLNWQSGPALTELEELTCDWMRQALGLSAAWHGVIQDTASTTSLVALICARERSGQYSLVRGGLQGLPKPLVVYASSQAHSSIEKAALLAGFGRENLRSVPVDERFAMRPDALEAMVLEDLARGLQPCAVVACTGTTTSTACDALGPVAEISQRHGLWLHVDGAMAGSAMILPEMRHLWDGIEGADSIVINPHKWLGSVFDCTLYFVRDPEHLVRVMSTNPSYLQTSSDGQVTNYRDWGIPLGRRFRALKLWFLLRLEGLEGLQARLRRDLENARWLEGLVNSTTDWHVLNPVLLQTLCVRHQPEGLEGEALDQHTLGWVDQINQSGEAYLTPAKLAGRWMVRVSIGAEPTEREHVARLWDLMRTTASRLWVESSA